MRITPPITPSAEGLGVGDGRIVSVVAGKRGGIFEGRERICAIAVKNELQKLSGMGLTADVLGWGKHAHKQRCTGRLFFAENMESTTTLLKH